MTDPASVHDRLAGLSREQRALLFEQVRQRKERARDLHPDRIPRRPPDLDPVPASFAQERLWFLDRLEPGSPAFNIPTALRLLGGLSPALLEAVLGEVVRRHEALRTTFEERDGQPAQVVAPPGRWLLPLVDLASLPEEARQREAQRLANQEVLRSFDLARGPLLRASLLKLAAAEHGLLLVLHHIVSDGWSMGVLVREITELYGAALAGEPSPLPELSLQYADFAVWQRGWLTGSELERQLAYWRRQLAEAPESLDLPADRPRPPLPTHRGARVSSLLDPDLPRALARLARRRDATLFMVLLAAFQALLGRLSGQEDLVVGSPIANRNRAEIEPLIGLFVNTLALRGDLTGDPSFAALVGRTRHTTLEAYSHQDLPFERLVGELKLPRRLATNPLFQVLCALETAPSGGADLPGLSLAPLEFRSAIAQFDLELNAWEKDGALTLVLTYSAELFDRPTVARIGGCLESLLQGALADDEQPLSSLPLLGDGERQQLLREWNDSERIGQALGALDRFATQAARTPDAVALEAKGGRLTYAELDRRADRLARRLRAAGVEPGVTVGLFAERSLGLIVGLLAVWKAGGAWLPLDPGHPQARLAFLLEDSQAAVVAVSSRLAESLPPGGARRVSLEDLAQEDDGAPAWAPRPGDPAYLLYTSGTTGQPKAVLVEHGNLASTLAAVQEAFGFGPGDRMPCIASSSFDIFLFELLAPLLAGGTAVLLPLLPTLDAERVAEELEAATLLHAVPAVMRQVVAVVRRRGISAPALRALFTGGDVVPADLLADLREVFPRARLYVLYGPTEATIVCTCWPVSADAPMQSLLGRPFPGAEIRVCDAAGRLAPIGVPGEIWIGGAGVARGYWQRPELTAEKFVELDGGRFFRSGDRARWLPEGALEFLGRADHQVKVRGVRIELGEIEAALRAHRQVGDAAVALRPGPGGDPQLVAYTVFHRTDPTDPTDPSDPVTAELKTFLKARLPEPMLPALFVALDALPLTAHGKVDRASLPAPEPPRAAGATPPSTGAEIALAGIWQELLGVERIGVEDNFFELGGHSLLATQLVSRVRAACNVDLPLRSVFESPTLGGLAAALASQSPAEQAAELRREPVLEAPLSYSQERLWFLDRLLPGSSVYNIPASLRLRGPLDSAVLARCLTEIVARHETLRTRFADRDGAPFQVIDPPRSVPLPRIDLASLPAPARGPEAERITAEDAALPFDLARGPVIRFSLLRLGELAGEVEHALLITLHHVVSDGWSIGVLCRELTQLYEAFSLGLPSPLPSLPVQYADFARWQREWLAGPRFDSQLAYWRERLAGHPQGLDLPRDRPRPAVQTFRGSSARLRLAGGPAARLRSLATEVNASAFMAVLAAFEILLQRLSGQEDILVGVPVAGRNRPELEGLIGFFLNLLVLRLDLSGQPTFRELVGRVREAALGAYAHQDVPFERLLADLQPERDLSRTPLFEILFNMLNFPPTGATLPGGLAVEPLSAGEMEAKFDLTIYASEDGEGFVFDFVYNADLFDRARADEMVRQYGSLLAQAAAEPDRPIHLLSLLTPAAAALLPDPTAPLGEASPGLVHELFAAHAALHPERPAIDDPEGMWTYGELKTAVDRLAAGLRRDGIGRSDCVAIYAHRSAPLAWALFGILQAGAAFVILDPTYPPARIATIVNLARPRAWLEVAAAGPPGAEVEERLQGLTAAGHLVCRLVLPGGGPAGARSLLATLPAARGEQPEMGPDDVGLIAFTSGSTGIPKGIVGRHGPLSHFLPWQHEQFGLTADDRHSMLSALSHDPLQRDVFSALCTGATLSIPSAEDFASPGRLAAWMARAGVTISNLTPAMAQMLTEPPGGGAQTPEIASLRWIVLAGDVLTRRDIERLRPLAPRASFANLYGATETQRALSYHVVDLDATALPVLPLGRGMPDCQLLVLDGAGRLAGIGEVGEIALRSPHLARGYLDDEALTRARFVANPFTGRPGDRMYRTGDLGRYLLNGEVSFAGRADGQVKIRGFRVETGEIEAVLDAQPGVRAAVVVFREAPGSPGDRRLVAYLVLDPERPAEPAAVREALRRRLPAYMIPSSWVVLERLPLLPNRKVDRRALPAPEDDRERAYVPPSTATEESLAEIWRALLGRERIGASDDFFLLGGHSLLATRVASRARDAFGIELPLPVLFQETTLAGLAAWIDRQRAPGPVLPKIQSRRRGAEKVLSQVAGLSDEEVQELLRRKRSTRAGGSE